MTNTNVTWNLKIAMINRKKSKVFFQTILKSQKTAGGGSIWNVRVWVVGDIHPDLVTQKWGSHMI